MSLHPLQSLEPSRDLWIQSRRYGKGRLVSHVWSGRPRSVTEMSWADRDRFVCWEPGVVSELKNLEAGQVWVGTQKMEVL